MFNKINLLVFVSVLLTIFGFGCKQKISLEDRLEVYKSERDTCIENQKIDFENKWSGKDLSWDKSEYNKAEYKCSTIDLATKYYSEDPEGIIELCVETSTISSYTKENGIAGGISDEELKNIEVFKNFSRDSNSKTIVDEETMTKWRDLCKTVIEGNF